MSDFHGEADRFHAMLAKIEYNKTDDTLYIVGDVIDRRMDGISLLLGSTEIPNAVVL